MTPYKCRAHRHMLVCVYVCAPMYKVVLVQNLAKSDYLHIHMAHSDINDPGVLNAQGPPLLSSCSGYTCIDLYVAMVRGQDHVPSTMSARQDKMRATMMFEHYDCMITQDEKNLFMNKNADKGSVVILKEHLDFVVLASLIWAFAAQKVCVYNALGDRYLLVFLQACKFVLPCHCLSLSPSPSLSLSPSSHRIVHLIPNTLSLQHTHLRYQCRRRSSNNSMENHRTHSHPTPSTICEGRKKTAHRLSTLGSQGPKETKTARCRKPCGGRICAPLLICFERALNNTVVT